MRAFLLLSILYVNNCLSRPYLGSFDQGISQPSNTSFANKSKIHSTKSSRRSHPFLDCNEREQSFLQDLLRSKVANVFRVAARAASPHARTSRYNDAKFQEYFGSGTASPANDNHREIVFERYKSLALEASLTPYGRLGIYCHGELPPVAQLHGQSPSNRPEPICGEPDLTVGQAVYVFPGVNEIALCPSWWSHMPDFQRNHGRADKITEMVAAFLEFGDLGDNYVHRPPEALFNSAARVEDFDLRRIHLVLSTMAPLQQQNPDRAVHDVQTLIWFAKAIWMRRHGLRDFMGIPGFSKDCAKYGEPVFLGQPLREDSRPVISSIVIDGPSLVYFIYYRLLSLKSSNLEPLRAQPSCQEICDGVHGFLQELQERNIKIEQIYFDGALPVAKRTIRNERLERERQKLHAFHKSCEQPQRATKQPPSSKQIQPIDLFNTSQVLPKFGKLPTPAFMVPAVIESLRLSTDNRQGSLHGKGRIQHPPCSFRAAVKVVPGEADEYCAAHARETGAAILTNDSDLLAYELGENGSVVKLDTLQLTYYGNQEDEQNAEVDATQWCPRKIAQQLLLKSLARLACARKRDPYVPSTTVLHRARQKLSDSEEDDFAQFLVEHDPTSNHEGVFELSNLDPRVSELFVQFKHPARLASSVHPAFIYLPIVMENPTRTACWTYGLPFRKLAYSVLNLSAPEGYRQQQIIEHQRRANRIAAANIELAPVDGALHELNAMGQRLQRFWRPLPTRDSFAFWFTFSVLEVSRALVANGKLPIGQDWTIRFLSPGQADLQLSWEDLHALASAQAVMYSLRIVKQLFHALQSSLPAELRTSVNQLSSFLDNLPNLASLMSPRWEISRDRSFNRETKVMIKDLYRLHSQDNR